MFGRLTLQAFEQDLIEHIAGFSMFLAAAVVIGLLFYFKRWKWLWTEWLTSLDPKRIGTMYIMVVFIMLFKGLVDAMLMRGQQILSVGDSYGYLSSSHFQQIFTAHGTTMIFFVGMGVVFGMMNLIIPLQIGARDVAFPFLNSLGFWLFAVGSVLVNLSLVIGKFSGAGWLAYPPLSGLDYNPGVGIDYWIWTLQIAGVGSLISGVNFIVTIFKMRCPGMTLMRMPIFVWAIFRHACSNHFCLSNLNSNARHALARSPHGHALFYSRFWWQSNDVHQPHLGMGASRSIYSRSACIWNFF